MTFQCDILWNNWERTRCNMNNCETTYVYLCTSNESEFFLCWMILSDNSETFNVMTYVYICKYVSICYLVWMRSPVTMIWLCWHLFLIGLCMIWSKAIGKDAPLPSLKIWFLNSSTFHLASSMIEDIRDIRDEYAKLILLMEKILETIWDVSFAMFTTTLFTPPKFDIDTNNGYKNKRRYPGIQPFPPLAA